MEIAHSSLQISLQMPLQPTYPPNPALPCKALPAQNSCTASIAAFPPPPLLLILLPSVGWVTSGRKRPPNYPMHQPCHGECDQETQHLVKFESKIKVSIGSLKSLAYCCTIFL